MTAGAVRNTLRVLFWNVHLFGQTAMCRTARSGELVETVLNFRDADRAERLVQLLLGLKKKPDVLGFAEVWDPGLRRMFQDRLRACYPHSFHGPEGDGLDPFFQRALSEAGPGLEKARLDFDPQAAVRLLVGSRYESNWFLRGASHLLLPSADSMAELITSQAGDQPILGAGMLLLSETPFLGNGARFIPHPVRVEGGRFALQGGIDAVVASPMGKPVRLFVTHLAEGVSGDARSARTTQIAHHLDQLDVASGADLVLMGDLNVTAERMRFWGRGLRPTREYRRMRAQLGPHLRDTFRTLHPDADLHPGSTYDDLNPISARKGIEAPPDGGAMRLDYFFHSPALHPYSCRVLRDEVPYGVDALSDHFPIIAEFG